MKNVRFFNANSLVIREKSVNFVVSKQNLTCAKLVNFQFATKKSQRNFTSPP